MDKRIISSVLVSTMVVSSAMTAIADETVSTTGSVDKTQLIDNESTEDDKEAEVRASIPSTFSVTIPKQITMDGTKKTADYKVKVTGDIAGQEYIKVVPEDKVVLKQSGKENVDAAISQEITVFRSSDYSEDTSTGATKISKTSEPTAVDGSIDASGVTAGTWSGTFMFNVLSSYIDDDISNLEPGFYDEYNNLVVSWADSGIDISKDYSVSSSDSNYYKTDSTSGYSILNKYPEITKVVIPDTVKSIGTYAFANCSYIEAVKIPSSITNISNNAFYGMQKLTTVDNKATITSIQAETFAGCAKLKNVTIPETVESIGKYAFNSCTSLESIVIPDSVTTIDQVAFLCCSSLKNVTLSSNLELIGASAFNSCSSLESLSLPESLRTVQSAAFAGTKLHDLYIPSGVTDMNSVALVGVNNIIYNGEYVTNYPWGATLPSQTQEAGFYDADDNLVISWEQADAIVSLTSQYAGKTLFNDYPTVTKVVVPDGVTRIEQYVFKECNNLTDVVMSNSITSIGFEAFRDCSKLKNIKWSEKLKTIDNTAFINCTSLTSIEFPKTLTSVGGWAFQGCTSLKEVKFYSNLTAIYQNAFTSCTSLTEITLPDSITALGTGVLQGCTSITTLHIPSKLKSIPGWTFSGCTSLTDISIPDTVTTIGDAAFKNCTAFESLTIPSTVTTIADDAFTGVNQVYYSGTAEGSPWGASHIN